MSPISPLCQQHVDIDPAVFFFFLKIYLEEKVKFNSSAALRLRTELQFAGLVKGTDDMTEMTEEELHHDSSCK